MVRTIQTVSLALAFLLVPSLAAQQAARFVEHIEVRVVNVDVVVTDRDGNPIRDLGQDDFTLFEDGEPVEITNFARIVEGRLELEPEDAPGEAAPSVPAPVAERSPVTWAVYLDQTNLSPGRRNHAIRELRKFLEAAVAKGDRGIVGSYDGATFRIQQRLTQDAEALVEAVARLENLPARRGPEYLESTQIRADVQSAHDFEEAPAIAFRIGSLIQQESVRTKNAILNLRGFLDVVAGSEGRLAVLYVGAGFKTLPGLALVEAFGRRFPNMRDLIKPTPEELETVLRGQVVQLLERIAATRATLYTVYAGDSNPEFSAEAAGTLDTEGGIAGDRASLLEVAAVRELADRSGGRTFTFAPGLATRLGTVTRDLSHYYSLGYMPRGTPGATRALRVEVNVRGARVRHREAARERSAAEQAGDAVVAALFDRGGANPLGVSIARGKTRTVRPGMPKLLSVSVKVPLAGLTFLPDGKVQRAAIEMHFAMAAEDGSVWRLESREQPLEIPSREFESVRSRHISYDIEVPLLARGLRMSASVLDQYGQVRSVATVPLDR